jgi:hypothetical protein
VKLPWMSRADRRLWRSARTLADLGELTALWLEGEIASQLGYQPNYGPDEETGELIPTLAAANRAGFLTTGSQPGYPAEFDDKRRLWQQKDAVEGFVTESLLLERLMEMADRGGYEAVVHHGPRPGDNPKGTVVTACDGEPVTGFGSHLTARVLRRLYPASLIHREAFAELRDAWQITLIGPEFGRSHLWHDLHDVVAADDQEADGEARCAGCGCTENTPCPGGCWWVANTVGLEDLCSACAQPGELITEEEIEAAAAALNAGDDQLANELVSRSGIHGRSIAMRVLGHCVED